MTNNKKKVTEDRKWRYLGEEGWEPPERRKEEAETCNYCDAVYPDIAVRKYGTNPCIIVTACFLERKFHVLEYYPDCIRIVYVQ